MEVSVILGDKIIDRIFIPYWYIETYNLAPRLTELYGNYGWTRFILHEETKV